MPTAPLKMCSRGGCGALVESGACPLHRTQQDKLSHRPDRAKVYGHNWRKVSRRFRLSSEGTLCEECKANGIFDQAAEHTDHVIPITVRPDLRLVRENLQGLCASC